MIMRHCIWIFALLLLSTGSLSAEDFGYELQDGKLTILMPIGRRMPVKMIKGQ